ncbi:MAG: hypothetical protein NMNS01_21720 [Nitrosomonas sp.]|nr:MAG: hypothetical protein NMNS01_21720 [Nitrosomonas sp.]
MNFVENLLSNLRKVKRTGHDRWIACCPSHNDKNPSLAIKNNDSKILLKCFAGCDAHKIVSAIGMDLSSLFPERTSANGRPVKNPFPASDVLRCIQFETLVVAVIASSIAKGEELTQERKDRLTKAAGIIQGAYDD